jgi:hypothetical protein
VPAGGQVIAPETKDGAEGSAAGEDKETKDPFTASAPIDAGTYDVVASFDGSGNYLPMSGSGTLLIEQATPVVTVDASNHLYDGQPHPASAYAVGVNGESLGEATVTYEPDPVVPVNAGTYLATGTYSESRNYRAATASAVIVIERAEVELSLVGGQFVFDSHPHAATASVTGVGGVDLGELLQLNYGPTGNVPPVDAGSYVVSARYPGSDNYNASEQTTSIAIARALPAVHIAGASVGYDGLPHGVAATVGGINGADLGAAVVTYAPGTGQPVDAGVYVVTGTYSGSGNYLPATGSATLTIVRGGATVRATGGAFMYDGLPHAATGSATGVNGVDLGPLTFTYAGSSAVPRHAGTYEVIASFGGNGNYAPGQATTTIAIAPVTLTVIVGGYTRPYGQPNPSAYYNAAFQGFVANEGVGALGGTLVFNTVADSSSPVGRYPLTASGLVSNDYEISYVPGFLSVTQSAAAESVSSSSNPAGYQQPIAIRADVSPSFAVGGLATGTVDFVLADGTLLGSSTVVNGSAMINLVLPSGEHAITARYSGDANVRATAVTFVQSVADRQGSSTTQLSVRPSPSELGETVVMEARVSANGEATGLVEFLDGGAVLGSGMLVSGRATYQTAALGAGTHILSARYLGSAAIPASSATAVVHNVLDSTSKARTMTKISTRNTKAGDPITIDVRVSSSTGVPTGSVEVVVDGQSRGILPVATDGSAAVTIAPLMPGEHKVSAVYGGSPTHLGSGSDVVVRIR